MHRSHLARGLLALWLPALGVFALAAGCDQPKIAADAPALRPAEGAGSIAGGTSGEEELATALEGIAEDAATAAPFAEPPADPDRGSVTEESWEAVSMQGSRMGYIYTTFAEVEENGRKLVRTRSHLRTRMQREGQNVEQQMTLTSWETPAGGLDRFESRMTAGPGEIVARGKVLGDVLEIEVSTLGSTQSQQIPWQAEWGGFFAADLLLRRRPMQPGEERTLTSLQPIVNSPAETRLKAQEYETLNVGGEQLRVLRIESTSEFAGQEIVTTLWTDDRGRTQKSFIAGLGQETMRTTKADALQPGTGEGFDLILDATVPLAAPLENADQTRRVVYRAHVTSGKIAGVFSECLSQQVKPIDDQTAEITVVAVRPGDPLPPDTQIAPPADEDRRASGLVQSDDPVVAALAAKIAPGEQESWRLALALEDYVHHQVTNKNYSQAFATAAEVARSLEGDCTEHAVLLAALCRARGIPARVAFGLVYYKQGFAYHMWNEVWVEDRWVPLDATRGRGGVGGDHIKLGDDSLDGVGALGAMLPVVQVLGRLELTVLAAE